MHGTANKYLMKLIVLAFLILLGTLNFTGFCFDKFRYLSEQEKIELAINKVLAEYPSQNDSEKFYQTLPNK